MLIRSTLLPRLALTLFALAALVGTGCAPKDPYLGLSPEKRIVASTRDALGGSTAYDAARILKFDFVEKISGRETARRNHDWDRKTDAYSIQWRDSESGVTYKVQLNPRKGPDTGVALTTGGRIIREDAERLAISRQAYGYFINDMQWLLAPYRTHDRATVTYVGREVDPRGALSERFDVTWAAGISPFSSHKVWVDPVTKRWDVWAVTTESGTELLYTWEDWRQAGPGMFSLAHRQLNGEHSFTIEKLRADPGMDQ